MKIKKIIKLYEKGSVCVCGKRGRGKDMLQGNIIIRRKLPYVSNVNYGGMYMPLDLESLDCGKNTYVEFIRGNVKKYVFPYPDKTDIYISDCGIYFPAQYCNELNKRYPYFATTQALIRQLGNANFHTNAQSLNRVWDKIREQSDQYILCRWCKVFFGKIVIQSIRIYDNYESALTAQEPLRIRIPLTNKEAKTNAQIAKNQFIAQHGNIKSGLLIYRNKSTYDTRYFKKLLEEGEICEK